MQVLGCFSYDHPELSVGDLSRRLQVHKSIVSRLVSTLRKWRLLEQDPATKLVRIGIGAFQLGALFVNRQPLHRLVPSYLGVLVERTRHSSHVAVLDHHRLLVIASVESPQALRVILRAGERRYLHATAAGKVLLAFRPPELLEALAGDVGLPQLTPRTLTSTAELRRELARVRRQNIAWNFEESTRGAGAVAGPIFGAHGDIAAAVCTVYPLSVVTRKELAQIGRSVSETAAQITAAMGGGSAARAATPPR
jgi:DNA-binding IclR family transcriptional regulator